MEPIALTLEDRALLPAHTAVTYGADQPQYCPLPAVRFDDGVRLLTRWSLTAEERAAVAAGEDLYLQVLTFGEPLQPLLPTIGVPDFCPADLAVKES